MRPSRPIERCDIQVDGTLDIETHNWTEFVIGGGYFDGQYEDYDFNRENQFIDRILDFEGTLATWNGGRFDTLWAIKHFLDRHEKCQPILAGQSIVRLKCRKLEIWDAYRLIPCSLDTAASIVGQRKLPTGLPCICPGKRNCGGYCSISRDMSPEQWALVRRYLQHDNKLVLDIIREVQRIARDNDLDLRSTIGSSSYATAARRLEIPPAKWSNRRVSESTLYSYARESYYGGRTQIFSPHPDSIVHRRDINSAYPAALSRLSLPTGERYECFANEADQNYRDGKAGLYSVLVRVPKMFIPPLPVRSRERINYPYGDMSGSWTGLELRYAESIGCVVESVTRAIVWMDSAIIFGNFFDKLFSLRREAKKIGDKGTDLLVKFFQNSLTGKLAQRPETESFLICPDDASRDDKFCRGDYDCRGGALCGRGCCPHGCVGHCGRYVPLDSQQRVWARIVYRLAACAHVHYAAHLTAYTRVELHRKLVSDGAGGRLAVMCDTDSCYSLIESEHGEGLGEWGKETSLAEFVAPAPKTYAGVDVETGEYVAKSKGIRDAALNFHRLRNPGVTDDRGVLSFKSAVKKGDLFSRKILHRHLHDTAGWYGDRKIGEDSLTHPMEISNLRGRR